MNDVEQPVDITTPIAWMRHWCGRIFGGLGIVMAALGPTSRTFGVEFITGYAKGIAIVFDPILIGAAVARKGGDA